MKTFKHAESTDDAQEKQARSYELVFAENSEFINSKFRAHFVNRKSNVDILKLLLNHLITISNGFKPIADAELCPGILVRRSGEVVFDVNL